MPKKDFIKKQLHRFNVELFFTGTVCVPPLTKFLVSDTPLNTIGDIASTINIYGSDTDINTIKTDINTGIDMCDKKIKEINDWKPKSKEGQELKDVVLKTFNDSKLYMMSFNSTLINNDFNTFKSSFSEYGPKISDSFGVSDSKMGEIANKLK